MHIYTSLKGSTGGPGNCLDNMLYIRTYTHSHPKKGLKEVLQNVRALTSTPSVCTLPYPWESSARGAGKCMGHGLIHRWCAHIQIEEIVSRRWWKMCWSLPNTAMVCTFSYPKEGLQEMLGNVWVIIKTPSAHPFSSQKGSAGGGCWRLFGS